MSIVVNTTVISNFAAVDRLGLLRELFGVVHIPPQVYQEIRTGLEEGYRFYEGIEDLIHPLSAEGWIRMVGVGDEGALRQLDDLLNHLDQGEAACVALAVERGWAVLTDDAAARKEARRLGVSLSGSVGCLALAVERGLCTVDEGNALLVQMIEWGYRAPMRDLGPLLGHLQVGD
jgi:predicted nucleic acid-binding protein